jgi:hypothetical protein
MKLGRKAIKTDSRTLKLARYLSLPAPAASADWSKGITDWGEMLNDSLGDCTIAACGHAVQVAGVNVGYTFEGETLADSVIESAYSAWDGYLPGNPSTDNGGIILDVLNDWKKSDLGGHHLLGFATANTANQTEIQQAIALFGTLDIGMDVPNFIMAGNAPPLLWDVVADDGGTAGGHSVVCIGFRIVNGVLQIGFISWGTIYWMTWAYWTKYVDEAYALLLATWVRANATPSGFNLTEMQADIAAIV